MPMAFFLGDHNIRVERGNARTVYSLNFDVELDGRKAFELRDKLVPINPQSDKPAEDHIAARAGKTVEIERFHRISSLVFFDGK
jgi:hypothetical protein